MQATRQAKLPVANILHRSSLHVLAYDFTGSFFRRFCSLYRTRTLISVKIGKSDKSPEFLSTTSHSNSIKSSADSHAYIGAWKPASDGKSPTDNAETQLTDTDLEIHKLHKEACEVSVDIIKEFV